MRTASEMVELFEAHGAPPVGMAFFDSLDAVRRDESLLGYMSSIERAWKWMGLSGVLCLDNRPILYLKTFEQPSRSEERVNLQRLLWNQGLANILVLADPVSVYIYSGLARPMHEDLGKDNDEALVRTVAYSDYVQNVLSFQHGLATGHFYDEKRSAFDPRDSVDTYLLENLRSLRDAIVKADKDGAGLGIKHAHAFIGRILFLCYLLDRRIYSIGQSGQGASGTILADSISGKQTHEDRINFLYGIFEDLKQKFNGNMFDQNLDAEKLSIQPSHINKLILFLGGHHVGSGQQTLGFWPYNFEMIPIETISAIYQDFLSAEDPEGQERRGAYYTPRFLAEMVVDLAIDNNPEAFEWSYLDPACGSAVFLVILFNRIARHWLNGQSGPLDFGARAAGLQRIMGRQLRGIDVEQTACKIACFSLYLAYLDFFEPRDIQAYIERTGKPLPKLLEYADSSSGPKSDLPVIYEGDSLAEGVLAGRKFDCVIGNPPWEGRQSKQLAQKFLSRSPSFLRLGGVGCLLLPSKILQNRTDAFQSEWLTKVSLKKVIQLADYSFVLFQGALCPAFIALFTNKPPKLNEDMVEFTAPKFNREGLRKGVITVSPGDRTWIPLSDIISATRTDTAPVIWKRHLWGSRRDQKLLDLLSSLPALSELAGAPHEGKRWIKGQGFQPDTSGKSKNPKSSWWNKTDLYIGAKARCWDYGCIQLQKRDCEEVGDRFPSLHRPRDRSIYKGPMVLASQGFFGKVAFCNFDVLFQHSLQSITGPREDSDLLMFLAAYLRSDLAKYFLFHTSANWGSERDKVLLFELLRVPFPLPGNEFVSGEAEQIVSQVALKIKKLQADLEETLGRYEQDAAGKNPLMRRPEISNLWIEDRKKRVNELQLDINHLIHRYFGLTEQEIALVGDTNQVFIPSSTPTWTQSPLTLEPVERSHTPAYSNRGLREYADTLTHTLNTWAEEEGSGFRVSAEGGTDSQTGLAMVSLKLTSAERDYVEKSLNLHLVEMLARVQRSNCLNNGAIGYERDLLIFHEKQVHIVRPNILLNWTRTAAINDASRIYGDISLAGRELQ
ncbi:MAG: N-6 DNA methylase [Syntrophobacteraceae bacterium]